ncbi:MAG: hypothetical protein FWB95_09105 [Treponema sp.]|nr:hypothetical protein [Treponema sp.]
MEYNFKIKPIEEIKIELYKGKAQITDFSFSIDFPFSGLYKEIVTKINPINISSNCELYNSTYSTDITEIYYDVDWVKDEYITMIKDHWFIGEANSTDYWIMDKNEKVYYWNSSGYQKKYTLENIIYLNINFSQWLQYAYLDKDNEEALERIFDSGYDEIILKSMEKETKNNYLNLLKEISIELYKFRKEHF